MEQQRTVPASQTAIENLPTQIICVDQVTSGNAICAICTDLMPVGEAAKELPCKHLYHSHCITQWLNRKNDCPVCRYNLPIDEPDTQQYDMGFSELFDDFELFDQHTVPASQSAIENLLTQIICVDQVTSENAICSICTDMMPVGEAAKQLPCNHLYHSHCIIEWLNRRNNCPLCGYMFPTDERDTQY